MMRRRPRVGPSTIRAVHVPAPIGGLNTVAPAAAMPAANVLWAYNVVPAAKGLRSRHGYREHCTGLTGGGPVAVPEVMAFQGATSSRLFATTATGIWDVTVSSAAPSQVLAFADSDGLAGWGVHLNYVTAAGHYLLYADEVNGLHIYTEATDTWARVPFGAGVGEISGVDPANVVHVASHKNRLWLTERDSARVWYLDAGAIFGAATSFAMGRQFRQGGTLVGCWSWTYDGGAGLDDSLVAVSTGGDVVVYQGTDPASATTWGLQGTWSVPPPPAGRRICSDVGGDLLLLTRSGIRALSSLVSGVAPQDKRGDAAGNIANRFAELAAERGNLRGWAIHPHPTDNALLVTVPAPDGPTEQLAYYLPTASWWPYRGLPMMGVGTLNGILYFGTRDGRVCANTGWVDNVGRTDSSTWSAIACGFLSAYQQVGGAGVRKLEMFRPTFLGEVANVASLVTARYNYDTSEPAHPGGNGGGGPSAWDSAIWGAALWGSDETLTSKVQGAAGVGREVALAVQWNAMGETTLLGVDVYVTAGGLL